MALSLEDGELELVTETVTCLVDGPPIPDGVVVLTDRRIVLLTPRRLNLRIAVTRPLLRAIADGATTLEPTHEIRKAEFAEVTIRRRDEIVFRGGGVMFAVASRTPFATWEDRMDRWVTGTFDPAPLPTARVVKR